MRAIRLTAVALTLGFAACAAPDDGMGGMIVRAEGEPVSAHCAAADATFRSDFASGLQRFDINPNERFGKTAAGIALGSLTGTLPAMGDPAREEGCVIEIMSSNGFGMNPRRVRDFRAAYREMRAG